MNNNENLVNVRNLSRGMFTVWNKTLITINHIHAPNSAETLITATRAHDGAIISILLANDNWLHIVD